MRSNPPDSSKRKEMFKSFSICHIKAETLFPFADVPHQQRFMWFLQYYCMAKSAEPPPPMVSLVQTQQSKGSWRHIESIEPDT